MKIISLCFFLTIIATSCKHDVEMTKNVDQMLYSMATESGDFIWYKNSDGLLNKSSLSGHQNPLSRTRYNTVAASHLNAEKKVIDSISFSEGSFIVKELYTTSQEFSLYAIMYKMQNHEFADANGWLWAYIKPDGEVLVSSEKKGASCATCHSQNGSIDLTLMNISHP